MGEIEVGEENGSRRVMIMYETERAESMTGPRSETELTAQAAMVKTNPGRGG